MSQMYPLPLVLNLESDTFADMKADFNKVLKRTLNNMEMKGSDIAEMTIKLKINLLEAEAPDYDIVSHHATREIIKPVFSHKVSSLFQIKDEESGVLKGDYELVWDKEIGDFVMKPITSSQQSFFDGSARTEHEEGVLYGEVVDLETLEQAEEDNEEIPCISANETPLLTCGDEVEIVEEAEMPIPVIGEDESYEAVNE